MDGARLVQLIINPGSSADDDTLELNHLADEYPYFSCIHALNAKIASLKNSETRDRLITRAAIISPDRMQLKNYITSDEIFTGYSLTGSIEEDVHIDDRAEAIPIEVAVVEQTEKTVEQVSDSDITETVVLPETAKEEISKSSRDILEELINNTEVYRKSLEKYFETINMFQEISAKPVQDDLLADPVQTEEKFKDILEASKKRKTSRKMPKEEQDLLISKFIEAGSENRKPVKSEQEEKTPSEDLSISSTELHDEMATETLAVIMVNQGKLEKAIDIYHKLIWKFPQKKSYFAAQIEILKEKISKQ